MHVVKLESPILLLFYMNHKTWHEQNIYANTEKGKSYIFIESLLARALSKFNLIKKFNARKSYILIESLLARALSKFNPD